MSFPPPLPPLTPPPLFLFPPTPKRISPIGHVAVISDDLSDVLRRHVFLLGVDETEFPFFRESLALQLLPLASFLLQLGVGHGEVRWLGGKGNERE